MITQSESIESLAAALAKAQAEMKPAVKDAKNPFFKSSYADLTSIWDACRMPLSNNGLAVFQSPETDEHGSYLVTQLCHSSGQWIRTRFAMKPVKDDPQSWGSVITYMRRYSLAAIAGVCTDDDDGNAASGKVDVGPKYQAPAPKLEVVKTDEEARKSYLDALKKAVTEKQFTKSDIIAYAQSKAMCPAGKHEVSSLNTAALEFLAGRIAEIKAYAEPEAPVETKVSEEKKPSQRQLTVGNPYTGMIDWKETKIHFGKWKNYTIHELCQSDEGKSYLEWLYDKWVPEPFKGEYSKPDFSLEAAVIAWKHQ